MKKGINWFAIFGAWAILGIISMFFATNFGHNLCLGVSTPLTNIYGATPTGWGGGFTTGCLNITGQGMLARMIFGPLMAFGEFPRFLAALYVVLGSALAYLVLKKTGALGK